MIEVLSLLTLPKTSNAFTATRSNAIDPTDNGSNRNSSNDGPFKIRIIGDEPKRPRDSDDPYANLKRSIRITLDRDSSESLPLSYEGLYNACRSVVTVSNKGEGLYECLKMELERSLDRIAGRLEVFKPEKDRRSDEAGEHYLIGWIRELVNVLDWFEQQVIRLQGWLTYLNQVYVPSTADASGVKELAFTIFKHKIFENMEIADILHARVEQWAEYERQLQLTSPWREDIKKLIKHLMKHQQYPAFENYYVQITEKYYSAESEETAKRLRSKPKDFFKDARNRIEQEILRSKEVLPVGSWSIVRETAERAIWAGHLEWIASETLGPYMETEAERHELGVMYELFKRVDGVKALIYAFRIYVRKTVEDIVKDQERDDDMVQRLLDFKLLADKTIATYFCDEKIGVTPPRVQNSPTKARANSAATNNAKPPEASTSASSKIPNSDFLYALTDAFNIGFKARRNKPAEMIAKHLDKLMRKGQGKTSSEEFEDLLDRVLALYRFTEDKDVFRTFYHRSLAKRLLLEKSASDDFEVKMLGKLKENYDPEFGMGEDMFKDLALSKEMITDYHSKLPADSSGHKLFAMVLQRSAWPFTVQKTGIELPPEMYKDMESFSNYYKRKHSGHTLFWDHALGTMIMKAKFKTPKELSLSLYQGIILLLFNEAPEWGFKDIKDRLRLEDGELRRTLQSLACGKKKVLKKVPHGKEVEDGDVFKFNADFQDERAKVHINSIQAKVSPEESKRTNISIEGDRKYTLDAAIVRIMKAKKEMTYEQLKTATIDAVKSHFVPQVDAIKKRIDSLVENDYLERSVEDKNRFLYVA